MKESSKRSVHRQEESQPDGTLKNHDNFVDIDHAFTRASSLFQENRLSEAEIIFHKIIEMSPDHPRALHALGVIAYQNGKTENAIDLINKSLHVKSDYGEAYNSLGNISREQNNLDEALDFYRKALEADPYQETAYINLGGVLKEQGKIDESEKCYRSGLDLMPGSANILINLAILLREQWRLEEATDLCQKAIGIKPDCAEAYHNLGIIQYDQGRCCEAAGAFRKALDICPSSSIHSNLLYILNYLPTASPEQIYLESRCWEKFYTESCAKKITTFSNSTDPERRLRIGYISPDFCQHSVSYFFKPLLEAHHSDKVHLFCYSNLKKPDSITAYLKLLSHRWRDCFGLPDNVVADQIRKDRIDILIDLAGHTANNRLTVLAEKPAPVQITWLGYPSTTGLKAIDYRLTDSIADPESLTDSFYAEKLYRLPGGFLCYAPPLDAPNVVTLPAFDNGFVTFGSFNNLAKMTSTVMALWATLLEHVKGSRLLLKNRSFAHKATRESCLGFFVASGIDPSRIIMYPVHESTRDHLALYGRVDISLDTFPYNGATTTCESLWMGVPVITLLGTSHAGRVGASILTRIGLEKLIARTPDEYVEIAVKLAANLEDLAQSRIALRERMKGSPLCNAEVFATDMERAYRAVWRTWCAEQSRTALLGDGSSAMLETGGKPPSQGEEIDLERFFQEAARLFHERLFTEAENIYSGILVLSPDNPRALHAQGVLAYHNGQVETAIKLFNTTVSLRPDFTEAHINLGNIYKDQGKLNEAAVLFRKAIALKPDCEEACRNLGVVLCNQGEYDASLKLFRKALEINSSSAIAHSNLLLAMNYSPTPTVEDIYRESLAWDRIHGSPRSTRFRKHGNFPDPERCLRVGYVSSDFCRHPVGYFLLPVLANHDRTAMEIYCYAVGPSEDDLTVKLRESADVWRKSAGMSDEHLAEQICADRIDILVDLAGHTRGNRLPMFAEKPAPVQVTWAGYVGTTGLAAMDYLISDWQETPEGSDQWYVEKVVRLPDCYVCYEPPAYAPAVAPLPALERGYVTFGCFNNLAKVTPAVVALWGRILRELPDARLLLISWQLDDPAVLRRYRRLFLAELGEGRVVMCGYKPHAELLASYGEVDIALDPFPYSGGLTTLESLWMGVPVLTLGGDRFASRHTLSHLTAVGLPELIADGPDDYVALAVELARDYNRLADMRRELRLRLGASPLCDGPRFTRNLEAAYRRMWSIWCAEQRSMHTDFLPGHGPSVPEPEVPGSLLLQQDEAKLEKLFADASRLLQQRNPEAAKEIYDHVLASCPDHPRALHALGVIAHQQGKSGAAISLILKALEGKPDYADAYNSLGNIYRAQGRLDDALQNYGKAVTINPLLAQAHNNLGNLFKELGRFPEAEHCLRQVIELKPDSADSHYNLAVLLGEKGRFAEAERCFRQAILIKPDFVGAYNDLGIVLKSLGKITEAEEYYHKALALDQNFEKAILNLGVIYEERGLLAKAASCFQKAISLKPDFEIAHNNLGNVYNSQGRNEEAVDCYRRALTLCPDHAAVHSNLLLTMNYSPEFTVADIYQESLVWGKRLGSNRRVRTHENSNDPERKLRIGYVSKDFGCHPVGYFLLPVLTNHDRTITEIYCYSERTIEDEITVRLREASDMWRLTEGASDRELAKQISEDRIDILVDLAGHTGGSRLLMFAEKPAPIQVTWAGYVGTTGLATMDYLISDWQETPEGSDQWYVEKVVRLPDCYICYAPPAYAPAVAPLPALVRGYVTFGCFNNLAKVTPAVVSIWGKIMRELPDARLLMITKQLNSPDARQRYQELFDVEGVGNRVEFIGEKPHLELLSSYNEVDLALDPFPYSGGLTTLESLWMGVPVLTLGGDRFASRHTLSHLTAAGLPELIVESPDDYVARAVDLAHDLKQLADMRRELRPRMAASPLCDGHRFTRNLEAAYREMWRKWCARGNAPVKTH